MLVKKLKESVAGAGGVVIHDSIGGDSPQYRTSGPMIDWTRIIIYRRARRTPL